MIVGQGLSPVTVGLTLGVGLALAMTRVVAQVLFAVEPTDPMTYAAVIAVLAAVAAIAYLVPARRAAAIDPMRSLREDRRPVRPAPPYVGLLPRGRCVRRQRHQDEPGEEGPVTRVPQVQLSILDADQHHAGDHGNRLDQRAVSKERRCVPLREREAHGKHGHQHDDRETQVWEKLVEDEQSVGGLERPEVMSVMQVEGNRQAGRGRAGQGRRAEGRS
jgi:hypothetical protein